MFLLVGLPYEIAASPHRSCFARCTALIRSTGLTRRDLYLMLHGA
jgi:hypothetical protein